MQPQKVVFCHHDELMPPLFPGVDTGEAIAVARTMTPYAAHVDAAVLGTGVDPR